MLKRLLQSKDFRYLVLYGFIGGAAAVVDFSVFTLCIKLLSIHALIANLISMHVGMLCSFSGNTFLNFKKTDKLFRRFLTYYVIVLIGMGISSLTIYLLAPYMSVLLVKVIAMAIATVLQYLLNRFITYKF